MWTFVFLLIIAMTINTSSICHIDSRVILNVCFCNTKNTNIRLIQIQQKAYMLWYKLLKMNTAEFPCWTKMTTCVECHFTWFMQRKLELGQSAPHMSLSAWKLVLRRDTVYPQKLVLRRQQPCTHVPQTWLSFPILLTELPHWSLVPVRQYADIDCSPSFQHNLLSLL